MYFSIYIPLFLFSLTSALKHTHHGHNHDASLFKRQASGQLCGVQNGGLSCPIGLCCNGVGICSKDPWDCYAPDCQYKYSQACDANQEPKSGPNTKDTPRPLFGTVPYGSFITSCSEPGVVALTFDDGPYLYTTKLLNYLNAQNINATFFITSASGGKGNLGEPSAQYLPIVQRMLADGHQIAGHTYSHQDLAAAGHDYRMKQMLFWEKSIGSAIGMIPTYMRPPYLSCDSSCQTDMLDLGYHIIMINLDTLDWVGDSAASQRYFMEGINQGAKSASFIVLAHDIHAKSVDELVPFMIQKLKAAGYRTATVGECLGDDPKNWYRHVSSGAPIGPARDYVFKPSEGTSPQTCVLKGVVSDDGKCGSQNGRTCPDSQCCSKFGWCGMDSTYCGSGCDPRFGDCTGYQRSCDSQSFLSSSQSTTASNSVTISTVSSQVVSGAVCVPSGLQHSEGRCGLIEGLKYVCLPSDCCSQFGYCGTSADHCGAQCQPMFGKCDGVDRICSMTSAGSIPSSSSSILRSSAQSSSSISSQYSSTNDMVSGVLPSSSQSSKPSSLTSTLPTTSAESSPSRRSSSSLSPSSSSLLLSTVTSSNAQISPRPSSFSRLSSPNILSSLSSFFARPSSSSSPSRSSRPNSSPSSTKSTTSVGSSRRASATFSSSRSSSTAKGTKRVTPDGTCGSKNGYSCIEGECCSQWGWCGTSSHHCNIGCQVTFGECANYLAE